MVLTDKVAIVTGSGGPGCGRAVARRLARDGCAVVVSDIKDTGAAETLRLIEADGGRAALQHANVRVESEVETLIAFAERTFGGLDIVVNNASAPYRPGEPMEHWTEILEADLLGPMNAVLYARPALRRRGGGVIINFGSTSAVGHGYKHCPVAAYDVAKAGVMRLTTALAVLQKSEGIRVNCIVPDWVATPEVKEYWDALTPEQRREQGVPAVLTSLDEIADAVVELITDERLAGRVMVSWSGKQRALIPVGDPGYARLEVTPGAARPADRSR
jgi:NAD(P)-dependent dehydrogenase (short-subunit alcohol dehydrogenase family)